MMRFVVPMMVVGVGQWVGNGVRWVVQDGWR